MKTKTVLNRCALLMLSLAPMSAMGQVSHSCTFTLSDWSRQVESFPGYELSAYSYTGLYSSTHPGQPMLPSRRVTLAVPYNATAFTVTVTDSTAIDTLETFTLKPMPQPRNRDESAGEDDPVFDQTIYSTNAFFPASPVIFGGEGYYMGEHHQLTLEVFPMRYNPVTHQLRRYTNLSFTVSWTTSAAQAAHAIIRNDPYARTVARSEAQSMVANPNQVAQFAPPVMVPLHSPLPGDVAGPEEPGYGGELYTNMTNYTIITTDSLKHALRKLVALKRQKGYSVTVKTVDQIANDPSLATGDCVPLGDSCTYISDTAGKMRQWLRNSFQNNNTQYALMAGKDVPFRYSRWENNGKTDIPTDWYFCDVNTNWNIDGDDNYGENVLYKRELQPGLCNDSIFDMNPDIYVGRLMFESRDDVENYTQKLLRYELNPGNLNTSYLGRALESSNGNIANTLGIRYARYMQAKLADNFSEADLHYIPKNSLTPNAHDLIQQINNIHYGFLNIEGHGMPNYIHTNRFTNFPNANNNLDEPVTYFGNLYGYNSETISSIDGSLEQLANRQFPSVMYAIACTTTPFDKGASEQDDDQSNYYAGRNMGQSFTLGKSYGGAAYIGYTRPCSIGNEESGSPLLAQKFFSLIDTCEHIGKTEAISKQAFTTYIDADALANNLMGDPEFTLHHTALTSFNGISISRDNHGVIVSGIDAGDDAATVSICNNTNQFQIKTHGDSVSFTLFDPNSLVMVRARGKLPYISPLVLQNTSINRSQYVIANNVLAGNHVDNGRTAGDVTIAPGVDYEIEHKGSVTLAPGFKVEKGATFSVTPSEY